MNLNLRIEWQAPFDNYELISAYRILIADTTQTQWIEQLEFCNGQRLNYQNEYLYCDIPIKTVLQQEPYNLEFDTLVLAKV